MLSRFHTSQSSKPAQESSMLDSLRGVQDSLGGAKARDSSRRLYSPLAAKPGEGMSCLA